MFLLRNHTDDRRTPKGGRIRSITYMAVLLNRTISFFLEMTGLASTPSAGSGGGKGMISYVKRE